MTGTFMAHLVTIAFTPLLSRWYAPAVFGEFGALMAVVNAFQVVACAKYEMGIVLATDRREALHLWLLSVAVTAAMSVFILLGVAISTFLPFQTVTPFLRVALWLLPLLIFLLGIYMACNMWLNRVGKFRQMAEARVSFSETNNVVAAILGYTQSGALGLFVANLIGHFVFVALLVLYSFKDIIYILKTFTINELNRVAQAYSYLPRTTFFQQIIEMLQSNALLFLLPALYDTTVTGYYYRTVIVFQAPVSLLANTMQQVVYRETAALHRANAPLRPLLLATLKKSIIIGLPICLVLLLAAPTLFVWVFGAQWYEAGVYAAILATWQFLDFLRIPINQTALVLGQQRALLHRTIAGILLLFGSFGAATLLWHEPRFALVAISATMSVFTFYLLVWLWRLSDK